MTKLLIVEDEATLREGLYEMIDWNQYGIDVCAPCRDGLEGYNEFINEKPDILLTDIHMPQMSGLELIKRAKETDQDFEAILLSGYNEFSYAKEGIKLGAFDYLLKPCLPEDVVSTVVKAKEKIEDRKKIENIVLQFKKTRIKHGTESLDTKQNPEEMFDALTEDEPIHKTVKAAVEILHQKYKQNITLDILAKEVFVSTAYLSSLFKQELGINFLDYLHKYRINKAKQLLKEDFKVYAVAKLVGYQDERHFSTTFKKWTGLTPTAYQRKI